MARFKLSDRARARKAAKVGRRRRRFFPTPGGRNRRAAHRQPGSIGYSAGSLRRARVGGCSGRGAKVGSTSVGLTYMAVAAEPLKSGSPGFSGGSTMRARTFEPAIGTKRVPPPTRPAGRFGGRGGIGYRYPGSTRVVMVGGELRDIGEAKCVPCSEKARAARG